MAALKSSVLALTAQGLGCLYALWKEEWAGAALAGFGMYQTYKSWNEEIVKKRAELAKKLPPATDTLDDYIARLRGALS